MYYLCEECCGELGITFSADAENRIGRKCCEYCQSYDEAELYVELHHSLQELIIKARKDTNVVSLREWKENHHG